MLGIFYHSFPNIFFFHKSQGPQKEKSCLTVVFSFCCIVDGCYYIDPPLPGQLTYPLDLRLSFAFPF